jgi:hypothetical protein
MTGDGGDSVHFKTRHVVAPPSSKKSGLMPAILSVPWLKT